MLIDIWKNEGILTKAIYRSCYHYNIIGGSMAQIIVRNLDDAVVDRLKARARDNDRSLEAEVRHILV